MWKTTGDGTGGRASLSCPLGSPYGKTLFFSGFGPDPSDGAGIESDLGEQFVSGGDIEFEVTVEHGLVSCSGGLSIPGMETGRRFSLSPAGRSPGSCFSLARRTETEPWELRGRDGRRQPLADHAVAVVHERTGGAEARDRGDAVSSCLTAVDEEPDLPGHVLKVVRRTEGVVGALRQGVHRHVWISREGSAMRQGAWATIPPGQPREVRSLPLADGGSAIRIRACSWGRPRTPMTDP